MGLYNVLFGENEYGRALVELINNRQAIEVGRYRDAWVEAHGDRPLIRIHTRNGGGNREHYDDPSMQAHPWYVRDEDDDFDCTYADYWFAPDPADLDQETMAALVTMAGDPVNMGDVWHKAIEAIGNRLHNDSSEPQ